jgi:hypothetical protein
MNIAIAVVLAAIFVVGLQMALIPRPSKRRQTCWVYCPKCRYELTASKNPKCFWYDQHGLVWYRCERCSARSQFDFDMPAPGLYFVDDFSTWMEMMDERIDWWHRDPTKRELHEQLGMTWNQYKVFAEDPKAFFDTLLDKHRDALYLEPS